ncbi:polysaccharide deacetylase family protein [Acrocarpospora catenulata]|uniref:polysaccharide deacetylase family protein n=1 Tax=Acrocarpospora catenulata TaxID=2836182 RepID=UPI001BDB10C1|nr:polysaccharide deacetylase family protein [Acrocarpospora catenulata]
MTVRKLAGVTAVANVVVVATGLVVLALLPAADNRAAPKEPAASPSPTLPAPTLPPPTPATVESARKVKANELGQVPVLMYHRIQKKRLASIDRTPAQLKSELEKLAKRGFVPITAAEFVAGEINIPAGAHPVVLTFDDGSPSHFALDARGLPKKDTAIGIIFEVAAKYPAFRPVATLWINGTPFGLTAEAEQARAVRWLLDHGFEVGNHTYSHPDLRRLPPKKVSEQIVRQERLLRKLGVTSSTTFALPFGSRPRKAGVAHDGKWDGTKYHFDGVFLAGAQPSVSPFDKGFDRWAIQRIQSNGTAGDCRKWCSTYWLEWFQKHPGKLYTADGDPESLSLPESLRDDIGSKWSKKVIVY